MQKSDASALVVKNSGFQAGNTAPQTNNRDSARYDLFLRLPKNLLKMSEE